MAKVTIIANKKNERLLTSITENALKKYEGVKVDNSKQYTLELDFTKKKKEVMSLLALTIASYIVIHIDDAIIRDAVEGECFDLPENDIEYLIAGIKTNILQDGDLYSEILFMLDESLVFNLNGYLNFRNRDRVADIREISYSLIEDFFTEKEIDGFVDLIKRFFFIQLPKTDYVNIIEKEDGEIEIISSDNTKVDLQGLRDELEENLKHIEYEINEFDLIASTMLSLLPREIHLHFNYGENEEIEYLLKKTFEGKVTVCGGCEHCESNEE